MACLVNGLYNALFGPTYEPISRVERKARPGDLIAFDRGTYQHYALYIGNGRVINVGAEDLESTSALISERTLEDVADSSYARIENHDDKANWFGRQASNSQEIIKRARRHLGRHLPYEFLFRNCEYYCTLWRFGVGFSAQVISAKPVTGINRYTKFAEHEATCRCNHDFICRCTVQVLMGEFQIFDLLTP